MFTLIKGEEGEVERKKAIIEEKPFSCEKCNKKFAHIRNLKNHQKKNNCGTKQCKFCEKTFDKQKRLTVHEHSHTKLFSCKYCEKRFSLGAQTRFHEKSCNYKNFLPVKQEISISIKKKSTGWQIKKENTEGSKLSLRLRKSVNKCVKLMENLM